MNYLEVSGLIYIVSVSYAVINDFWFFILEEKKKIKWREIQKIKIK